MAEEPGSDEAPLGLQKRIAQSRELVVRDVGGLRYELNFPLKFRKLFQQNTMIWIGGALALGLLLALLRARPQKIYMNANGKKMRGAVRGSATAALLLSAVKMGVTLAQPLVLSYLAKKGFWKKDDSRQARDW